MKNHSAGLYKEKWGRVTPIAFELCLRIKDEQLRHMRFTKRFLVFLIRKQIRETKLADIITK